MSPWNYEDHIDIDTTAELFIRRMTGECSYLDGEDVLAKNSLLYEKYCFFNELASLSFTEDGDSWMSFDAGMRKAIYDAASDGKTMTVKRIESVLQRDFFIAHPLFVVRRIRKPCLPSGSIMHISAGSST